MTVNRGRLMLAAALVMIVHTLLYGQPFPLAAEPYRFLWLGLSGLIGLALGDSLLFQCYVLIGPRIGILLLSLGPVFGTLIAWLLLGERLTLVELAAMALALGGMTWVVLERGNGANPTPAEGRRYGTGILLGAGAALCQSTGLVVAKLGLAGGFPALSAVVIRMTVAMAVMWLWTALRGQAGSTIRRLRGDPQTSLAIFGGTVIGPFIGVWLSLVAVQAALVGVASTLMAMSPVLSLPLARWVSHERVSRYAVLGTVVAMIGVACMFLV